MNAKKKVLFLCTGNYYRSRFAEELFNCLAAEFLPNWSAESRALGIEAGVFNHGPISPHALAELAKRNISLTEPVRDPLPCTEEDLLKADHIIALKEEEHRPQLDRKFPESSNLVEYWHIHDIDQADPEQALEGIAKNVRQLIDELRG
jgi:protein-tyrosine phosphatase